MDRRLTTILAADMVGYSRLMAADEEGVIARLRAVRAEVIDPAIAEAGGRIVKTMGDGLLAEFPSPVAALRCALAAQREIAARETGPEADRLRFRVGINLGDIVIDGDDILGDGVNVAARLEALAEPGGVCISRAVHDQVRGKVDATLTPMGPQKVKNIPDPVEVWKVGTGAAASSAPDLPDKPSIVVLPFDNMSADPDQEFFCDGLVEDVTTALSRFPALFVIARNTAFTFRGKAVDVRAVGRELGVRYVLEGSVRRAGNRLRVTAQLIDAETDRHVWAERFDRDLSDIFAIQDEISQAIVMAVAPEVSAAEMERVSVRPLADLRAWERVARADWHMRRYSAEDNLACQEVLEAALAESPEYVPALSLLAFSFQLDALYAWNRPSPESLRLAAERSAQAARLAPKDPDALAVHGLSLSYRRQHRAAVKHLEQALALNPNASFAHGWLGIVLTWMREFERAERHLVTAATLSPRDIFVTYYLAHRGAIDWLQRRYDTAIEKFEEALRAAPENPTALRGMAVALAESGDLEAARAVGARIRTAAPHATAASSAAAVMFAFEEDEARFRQALVLAGMPE